MIYYNNRQLSDRLGIGHAKWKRWVREFLPADPLSGRQSGYTRQLNLRDAFKVYLGGHLVSRLKFTIPEAQSILSDLSKWMKQNGFFNLHLDQLSCTLADQSHKLVFIIDSQQNGFYYVVRDILSSSKNLDETQTLEAFIEAPIGNGKLWTDNSSLESARVISMTNIFSCFINKLRD